VATDEKAELDRIQRQAAREIAALFRPLAEDLPELIRQESVAMPDGTRRLDPVGRIRVMHAVDSYLDDIFGGFPGDASPLEEIIVRWANEARSRPVRRAVADLRRRAGRRLAEAMEDGAANT
jgi:hypothetical protein